jgi:hypothetical protein
VDEDGDVVTPAQELGRLDPQGAGAQLGRLAEERGDRVEAALRACEAAVVSVRPDGVRGRRDR